MENCGPLNGNLNSELFHFGPYSTIEEARLVKNQEESKLKQNEDYRYREGDGIFFLGSYRTWFEIKRV